MEGNNYKGRARLTKCKMYRLRRKAKRRAKWTMHEEDEEEEEKKKKKLNQ